MSRAGDSYNLMVNQWSAIFLVVVTILSAGCTGGPDLNENDLALTAEAVDLSSSRAGIELGESDRRCVVEKLSADEAVQLLDELGESGGLRPLPQHLSDSLAKSIVGCVGADDLVRSGLLAFAGQVSEESQICAGETFSRDLLGELVSSTMSGAERNSTEMEIEIALALGQCLTPDELLRLNQG